MTSEQIRTNDAGALTRETDMKRLHATRARRHWRAALLGALLAGALPAMAAPVVLITGTRYQERSTGASDDNAAENLTSGATVLRSEIAAPGSSVFGPSAATAYADASGTFWVHATTGTIEPYSLRATASWESTEIKATAGESPSIEITGATLGLMDYGSFYRADLLAGVRFVATLNETVIYMHDVRIFGRAGPPTEGNFHYDPRAVLPGARQNYSVIPTVGTDFVLEVIYNLQPITLSVDLGSVAVGESYTLRYFAEAFADGGGGETKAVAYFRDPVSQDGGIFVSRDSGVTANVPTPSTPWLLAAGVPAALWGRRRNNGTLPFFGAIPPTKD